MNQKIPNTENFSRELKKRVELKTGPATSSEKVLLDAFKYFDLNGTGLANLKSFVQVMKMKVGITSQTEDDLAVIFADYSQNKPTINYRELISRLFESQMNLSLKEPSTLRESNHLIRDKNDLIVSEELIRKNIEYIIYKLRSFKHAAFLNLFRELRTAQVSENEISQSAFTMVLKKLNIEINSDEIQRIFYFIAVDKQLMPIDRFIDLLLRNFSHERRNSAQNSFAKFDYMSTGKVSLQLIKDLFNGRNTFPVREGRLSAEEMAQQFAELTDNFTKYNGNNFIVDAVQFGFLFSFISAYIKEDKEFYHFVDNCFRYSELPRAQGSIRQTGKPNAQVMDDLTIRTCQLEDIFNALTEQLNSRGNRGYINFYKALKCNDFDSDGYVFEKEFDRSVAELRMTFSSKQTAKLFEKAAVQRMKLDYHDLMNQLVPKFDIEKKSLVQQVWDSLDSTSMAEVTFDRVVGSFHSRLHPDFKNGHRPDYEIRTEFVESLQTLLTLTRGSHLKINKASLIRFFEFFGRNWSANYLQSVLEFTFKIKGNGSVRTVEVNAPYGTISENQQNNQNSKRHVKDETNVSDKPGVNASQYKYFQEYSKKSVINPRTQEEIAEDAFKKKPVDHTVNYPYFTDDKDALAQKNKLQNGLLTSEVVIPNPSKNDVKIVAYQPVDENPLRSHKYLRDQPPKQPVETAKENQIKSQTQKHVVYSPEEGSVVSKTNIVNSKELNERINDNSSRKGPVQPANAQEIQEKFTKTLRFIGRIPTILQLEHELTTRSDDQGFVDFEVFSAALEKLDLVKAFKNQELQTLYLSNLSPNNKLHVQNFANKIRGQMTQNREKEMIQIFDRMNFGESEIPIFQLKNAFLAQKFRFHVYKTMTESRDMFSNMVDLFQSLNLAVKGKESLSLDDFLYLCDNFSFYISAEEEFIKLMNQSFK